MFKRNKRECGVGSMIGMTGYERLSKKELVKELNDMRSAKCRYYVEKENARRVAEYYMHKCGLPYVEDGFAMWSRKKYCKNCKVSGNELDAIEMTPVPTGNYTYHRQVFGKYSNYIVFKRTYINDKNETVEEYYTIDTDSRINVDYSAINKVLGETK